MNEIVTKLTASYEFINRMRNESRKTKTHSTTQINSVSHLMDFVLFVNCFSKGKQTKKLERAF